MNMFLMISNYVSVGSFGIMDFYQERFKKEWVINYYSALPSR